MWGLRTRVRRQALLVTLGLAGCRSLVGIQDLTVEDGGVDASVDAGAEGGVEGAVESAVEGAAGEAAPDAGAEASGADADASVDGTADVAVDSEAAPEAGGDAAVEAEAGSDAEAGTVTLCSFIGKLSALCDDFDEGSLLGGTNGFTGTTLFPGATSTATLDLDASLNGPGSLLVSTAQSNMTGATAALTVTYGQLHIAKAFIELSVLVPASCPAAAPFGTALFKLTLATNYFLVLVVDSSGTVTLKEVIVQGSPVNVASLPSFPFGQWVSFQIDLDLSTVASPNVQLHMGAPSVTGTLSPSAHFFGTDDGTTFQLGILQSQSADAPPCTLNQDSVLMNVTDGGPLLDAGFD